MDEKYFSSLEMATLDTKYLEARPSVYHTHACTVHINFHIRTSLSLKQMCEGVLHVKHRAPFPLDFESKDRIVDDIWTSERATSSRSRGDSTETVVGALALQWARATN
jgi:hypothetical protein